MVVLLASRSFLYCSTKGIPDSFTFMMNVLLSGVRGTISVKPACFMSFMPSGESLLPAIVSISTPLSPRAIISFINCLTSLDPYSRFSSVVIPGLVPIVVRNKSSFFPLSNVSICSGSILTGSVCFSIFSRLPFLSGMIDR